MLDFATVVLVLICGFHLVIGLLVYLKNRRDRSNQLFFLFALAVIGWLIVNDLSNVGSLSYQLLLSLNKLVFIFPAIIAVFALMFAISYTGLRKHLSGPASAVLYGVAVVMVAASATSLVVAGITQRPSGIIDIQFGRLAILYFAYLLVYFGAFVAIFYRAWRRSSGVDRVRYQYVVAGIFLSFAVALFTNLVLPLVGSNFSFVVYAPFATLFMLGSISYGMIRHRLFDIKRTVARAALYVLLLALFAAIYGIVAFVFSAVTFHSIHWDQSQLIVSVVIALVLAITFQPLRRIFERASDRVFFRDHYDSQEVLNRFSQILVSELDLDRVLKRSLTSICRELRIQYGQVIIFNHDRVYRVEHFGPLPKKLMVVPELKKLGSHLVVADELEDGERRLLMEEHGIRVSTTLRTRDEFVGYLLLGDKLSGDIYGNQDVDLIEIIIKELAVAIMNAKAYAEIAEFNVTLQERVDHATNRLRVANRHLKELDKAKDEFISMASHQLRTPLTTIKGYLSMLLEGDAGRLTHTEKEYVDYAFGASERMVNLISDLLNVSRLSAGRFLIQATPTDMVQMVADEVRQLQSHAAAKNITLTYEPPSKKLAPVELDDNKTRQVVMNFIDNAIYYTKQGGVTVRLEKAGMGVRLEVQDSGIGVPEAAKKKLFSKFFRADNAQTVRPDGTGLGLYLAKRVVEDQGGTIIFRSTEGKGSTFGFELPFKAHKAKPEGA